jgi:invasion protein IalB
MGRAEQYDQWILQCAESTTSGNEKCNLIHQLVNDKKQQIVKIEVLKQGANNMMLFHLPLGTHLPAGAVLIVGEGAYKIPITACMPAGCKASIPLDWNLNQQLKREDKAIVQLLNVNQKQKINIEFSLMGFSNGSKEIK